MPHRLHRHALSLSALSALVILASCGRPGGGDQGPSSGGPGDREEPVEGALERSVAAKVQTAPLEQREMVQSISTVANAESIRQIMVMPRTAGIVTEVLVEVNDRVEAGQVLMRLDDRDLRTTLDEAIVTEREAKDALVGLEFAVEEARAQLDRAQLQLTQSERELERKEGVGGDLVSRNELDQLRLTVATNKADLAAQEIAIRRAEAAVGSQQIAIDRAAVQRERAELNLSFTEVEAPFAGTIAKRDVRVGQLVTNTTEAFTLTDADHLRVILPRPQREFGFFGRVEARVLGSGEDEEELEVIFEPEALPGLAYDGRFLFKDPTIDPATGQFGVTLGVVQPNGPDDARPPVQPGMLVRARIVTERHPDALVVPKRALVREGDSYFVFAIQDGRASRIEVDEGFASDEDVEIVPLDRELLEPGMQIVVVGNRDLEEGDQVDASVWPPKAPPAPAEPEAGEAAESEAADETAPAPNAEGSADGE